GVRRGPPAQLDVVDARNGNVSEDQIGRELQRLFERLMTVVRLIDHKTVARERVCVKLSRLAVVFDHQDPWSAKQGAIVSARGHSTDHKGRREIAKLCRASA